MSSVADARRERLEDLLADQACQGLTRAERQELDGLRAEFPAVDGESFELAAAALELALLESVEPMPAALRERIVSTGIVEVSARATSARAERGAPSIARRSQAFLALSWSVTTLAAAVALVAVLWGLDDRRGRRPLVSVARDTVELPWTAMGELSGRDIGGGVNWSLERQEGVLTFRGLPVNDPSREQYQLWILDGEREHPVDGGVFDIRSANGESTVAIDAKLEVIAPTGFAVTIEKPKGVVVSRKDRLVLLAQY